MDKRTRIPGMLHGSWNHPQPELVIAWKGAIQLGIAGALCDRIVRTRDVPDRLADVLCYVFEQQRAA